MDRTIGMERVFSLGDYKSIRFSDTISELPKEIMFNNDLVEKIRYLQMLNVQLAYEKYVSMYNRVMVLSEEERISMLIEEKLNTLEEIKHLFKE